MKSSKIAFIIVCPWWKVTQNESTIISLRSIDSIAWTAIAQQMNDDSYFDVWFNLQYLWLHKDIE